MPDFYVGCSLARNETCGLLAFAMVDEETCMSDDLSNRGPQDRSRINLAEDHEVRYWTKELGITEAQLRAAVQAVGVSATAVRAHLGK